jgi:hypothetical protein
LKCFNSQIEFEKREGSFYNKKWNKYTKNYVSCGYEDEYPKYNPASDDIKNVKIIKQSRFSTQDDYIKYADGYDFDRETLFSNLGIKERKGK